MPGWVFLAGLTVYDLMARQWAHRSYDADDVRALCPILTVPGLLGGYRFYDAATDDARLVLRVIRESVEGGAVALNYARVESLLRTKAGQVCGVVVSDTSGLVARQAEIQARVVISATGVWGDRLRGELGQSPRLRATRQPRVDPIRSLAADASGHVPAPERRPPRVRHSLGRGRRLRHHRRGPRPEPDDRSRHQLLGKGISSLGNPADFSRPGTDGRRYHIRVCRPPPSGEHRQGRPVEGVAEHAIWDENGLLTVSGGKLTTFRVMARDALKAAAKHIGRIAFDRKLPVLDPIPADGEALFGDSSLTPATRLRLLARYGASAVPVLAASAEDLQPIDGTDVLLGRASPGGAGGRRCSSRRICSCARVRLGLLSPHGGRDQMARIRGLVQSELGWDECWGRGSRLVRETVARVVPLCLDVYVKITWSSFPTF